MEAAAPRSILREGDVDDAAYLKSFSIKINEGAAESLSTAEQLSEDYSRVVVHSFKVRLAITLVSTFYCFWLFRDSFAMNVLWGILTTAIVFEPTIGAMLARGFNRIVSIIVAAALGIGAHRVACLSGRTSEPVLLGFFVFLIVNFVILLSKLSWQHSRDSFPGLKRQDQVITVALTRTSTIVLGCCTAIIVCTFVFPSWSGMELHELTATDMDNLGKSLQGIGSELLDPLQEQQTVLTSKHTIETLACFAGWEPGHGEFRLGHPWKRYSTIGSLIRQCAFMTEALDDFRLLNINDIQISADARSRAEELLKAVKVDCGKSFREMASTLRKMTPPEASIHQHLAPARSASNDLRCILQSAPVEVASLPIHLTECTDRILEAVKELASLYPFRQDHSSSKLLTKNTGADDVM